MHLKKTTAALNLFGALTLSLNFACGGANTAPAGVTSAANAPASVVKESGAAPATAAPAAPAAAASEDRIAVTAVELYTAYDKDEAAADKKYKGQQLAVTGIIEDIELEGEAGVNVDLKAGDLLDTIFCFFEDSEKVSVAKLKKGQKVTVKCVGEGKFVNPVVRFCEVAG